jgi:hypothetical protein
MLSLGGVNHLTGGGKKEGRVTCETLLDLCNGEAVEMTIDGGATLIVEAGKAPIVNGQRETRMRVGCGSADHRHVRQQWRGLVDEVVVVDDHITGVLSEHQAGKFLDVPATGIRDQGPSLDARPLFPRRRTGLGWGGTNITDPLQIVGGFDPKRAWPGLRLLMVSTTGEHARAMCSTTTSARRASRCPPPCRPPSRVAGQLRTGAVRRCCSWRAPAARCAPA